VKRPRRLICACCGSETIGRQWWNRDTGYGLCTDCIDFVANSKGMMPEEMERSYGKRGVHYDVPQDEWPTWLRGGAA
jgi:hypothetical protein